MLAENKVNFFMFHLTDLLRCFDSWGWLGTFEDSKDCVAYLFPDIELVLSDSKIIYIFLSYFTCRYWLEYVLVSKNVGIAKAIEG